MKVSSRIITLASLVILVAGFVLFLTSTASILKPLVFAVLISLTLLPLQRRYERKFGVVFSTFLTLLTSIIPIMLAGAFVYFQLSNVIRDLPNIGNKLNAGLQRVSGIIKNTLPDSLESSVDDISSRTGEIGAAVAKYAGAGLTGSMEIIGSIFLCGLMIFFLLMYRVTIKNVLLIQFNAERRQKARLVARRVRSMLSNYLSGLLIVILIVGILNSLGLFLIGIDYAVFWGFLAAFLTVIPYIGTTIGGSLPFLYSLATATATWQPVAVVLLYGVIQQLEGNLITPKVVGDKVKINPLVAIIGLLVGALIWGIAGIVLSIPILAIVRIIFNQIDPLKPIAILMSSEISDKAGAVFSKYDHDRYRLENILESYEEEVEIPNPQSDFSTEDVADADSATG